MFAVSRARPRACSSSRHIKARFCPMSRSPRVSMSWRVTICSWNRERLAIQSRYYGVTHLTNIVDLDVVSGIQFRTENGHLFQRLHEFITEVCQRLNSVANRGNSSYKKYEERNNTTSSITVANSSPMKRVALSSCLGMVITGDRTMVISGSISLT